MIEQCPGLDSARLRTCNSSQSKCVAAELPPTLLGREEVCQQRMYDPPNLSCTMARTRSQSGNFQSVLEKGSRGELRCSSSCRFPMAPAANEVEPQKTGSRSIPADLRRSTQAVGELVLYPHQAVQLCAHAQAKSSRLPQAILPPPPSTSLKSACPLPLANGSGWPSPSFHPII